MAGLASLGAVASETPLIELRPPSDRRPLDEALRGLARYEWLVFTSANAVEAGSTRLAPLGVGPPARVGPASRGPAAPPGVRAGRPGARGCLRPARGLRAAGLV